MKFRKMNRCSWGWFVCFCVWRWGRKMGIVGEGERGIWEMYKRWYMYYRLIVDSILLELVDGVDGCKWIRY